jgi:hypothetical protein
MTSDPIAKVSADEVRTITHRLTALSDLVGDSRHLHDDVRSSLISSLAALSTALSRAETADSHERDRILRAAEGAIRIAMMQPIDPPHFSRGVIHLVEAGNTLKEREPQILMSICGITTALGNIGI